MGASGTHGSASTRQVWSVTCLKVWSVTCLKVWSVTCLQVRSVTCLKVWSVTCLKVRSVTCLKVWSVTCLQATQARPPGRTAQAKAPKQGRPQATLNNGAPWERPGTALGAPWDRPATCRNRPAPPPEPTHPPPSTRAGGSRSEGDNKLIKAGGSLPVGRGPEFIVPLTSWPGPHWEAAARFD